MGKRDDDRVTAWEYENTYQRLEHEDQKHVRQDERDAKDR